MPALPRSCFSSSIRPFAVGRSQEQVGKPGRAPGMQEARAEIDARLTEWTRERSAEEVTETLQAWGVSAMFVRVRTSLLSG